MLIRLENFQTDFLLWNIYSILITFVIHYTDLHEKKGTDFTGYLEIDCAERH